MQVINRLSDASRKAHKKEWQIVMKSMEIALKIMSKNTKLQREYRAVAIDQLAGYYGTKGRRLPKIWQFQGELCQHHQFDSYGTYSHSGVHAGEPAV